MNYTQDSPLGDASSIAHDWEGDKFMAQKGCGC